MVMSPPENAQRLMPRLAYLDAPAAIEFLHRAFGFEETARFAPGGKVVRYLYGTSFLPFNVTMAITEAAQEHGAGMSAVEINRRDDGRLVEQGFEIDLPSVLVKKRKVRGNGPAELFVQHDVGGCRRALVAMSKRGGKESTEGQNEKAAHYAILPET